MAERQQLALRTILGSSSKALRSDGLSNLGLLRTTSLEDMALVTKLSVLLTISKTRTTLYLTLLWFEQPLEGRRAPDAPELDDDSVLGSFFETFEILARCWMMAP